MNTKLRMVQHPQWLVCCATLCVVNFTIFHMGNLLSVDRFLPGKLHIYLLATSPCKCVANSKQDYLNHVNKCSEVCFKLHIGPSKS